MTGRLPARHREPRVFTIAPGVRFLPTLADALLDGTLLDGFPDPDDPLGLSAATIFLPTRRAARALTAHLAERAGSAAMLLPRIVPLGDVDDGELTLGDSDIGLTMDGGLPPPVGELERRLVLTQLVLAFARTVDRGLMRLEPDEALLVPSSPADAYALAGELGRLMDALAIDGVGWEALRDLVDERFDRYFAVTLEFLEIAAKAWPRVLAERGVMDPVHRRNLLLNAAAARLLREGPALGPMVVAGSTGSVPATARLIAAVSRSPLGAVVLPGLDTSLDRTSWESLARGADGHDAAHGHPQAVLSRLLAETGISREAVVELGRATPLARARALFLSEALRPAATTECWAPRAEDADADRWGEALADLAVVDAADEREEALVASLVIREALESPDATAALVTPDRGLAERVGIDLKRWGIDVEDSAGIPLVRTLPGRLALLAATAAASDHAPRDLVTLLAHPFVTLGRTRAEIERAASVLEIGVLRGPVPPPGIAGLRNIFADRRAAASGRYGALPAKRLTDHDWATAARLIDGLEAAFEPLRCDLSRTHDFVELADRHRAALVALAAPAPGELDRLFGAEAGEALEDVFDELSQCSQGSVVGSVRDFAVFFAALAGERRVRARRPGHARVKIWGLLEARLLEADHVVVGGLDEGIWPPAVRTDAFLNRPMRASMGLPPPERRIGQTAHDFVAALGNRHAVIIRALKREGSPTVPSRFLQRMKAVAGPRAWEAAQSAGLRYRMLAGIVDMAPRMPAVSRPAPRPARDLLPRALSVTEIETLVRDPYSIFARHVLRLDRLEDLAVAPGAADRGTLVHDIIGGFTADHPDALPPDALVRILSRGRDAFAALEAFPDVAAQWWPRFERLAAAFLRWEMLRRPKLTRVAAEIPGSLALSVGAGESFTLRARADRIEQRRDGMFTVVDFKTGSPPTSKMVFAGFAPQLTLEAAMLMRGAFAGIASAAAVPDLLYLHLTGGTRALDEGLIEAPSGEPRTVEDLIEQHLARLETMMGRYFSGEIGFMARPYAQYARRFNEYDHLARTREWSVAADAVDETP